MEARAYISGQLLGTRLRGTRQNGEPFGPEAWAVLAIDAEGKLHVGGGTSKDGTFRVGPGQPDEEYRLVVFGPGDRIPLKVTAPVPGGDSNVSINLDDAGHRRLVGRLAPAKARLCETGVARAYREGMPMWNAEGAIEEDGAFTIARVPADALRLDIVCEGRVVTSVTVPAGASAVYDVGVLDW